MYDETPIIGPWWASSFGPGGAQAPEEVPLLAVDAQGKPDTQVKTGRQLTFTTGSHGAYDMAGCSGPVSGVSSPEDTNHSNPTDAMRRATGRLAGTYHNYRRMRGDGIVAIGREVADGLICTSQWGYELSEDCAADSDGDGKGDFGEDALDDMVRFVKGMWEGRGTSGQSHEGYVLREFFLAESCRAKDYGNATLEVAYGEDAKGLITIAEFLPCLPENTRPLVYAGTRTFAGVRNWGIQSGQVDLDPEYCVRFLYDTEGGDLFGRSRFENCKDRIGGKWNLFAKLDADLNITIGNTMDVKYPMGATADDTAINEAKARTIVLSAGRGMGFTRPGFSTQDLMTMARAGVDPSKVEPWAANRLETGTTAIAGFAAAVNLLDEQILFGLLVLPRVVREAEHGAKADSETHTATMATMAWRWICYVAGMAQNLTDRVLVYRYGEKARGRVLIKPIPITDEALAILTAIYTALFSDKELAVKVLDIRESLEKLKIPMLPDFDQKILAKQMASAGVKDDLSSRARLAGAGHSKEEIDAIQKDRASEDAVPTDPDGLGAKALSEEEPHKFSSTQIQLDEASADEVRNFGQTIPDDELAEGGLEKDIHVTVKYGLHSAYPDDAFLWLMRGMSPVKFKVGKTSLFQSPDYDVLKLDVEGEGLHAANKAIAETVPCTDTYPEYHPHVTIAYLKPGMGAKYVGRNVLGEGERVANSLIFASKDDLRIPLAFGGQP